jgi:hypothetical protein
VAKTAKVKKPTGYILYRGPSLLDGNPVVVIAIVSKSRNKKTGNVVQTYILRDNGKSPYNNAMALDDYTICGECPHRRGLNGACYVNLGQGPHSVFRGLLRDIYPYNPEQATMECAGRMVRIGTYGDPAAVPKYVWDNILHYAHGHTGYSHQWKTGKAKDYMDILMASADNPQDYQLAHEMGYRTFRVRLESQSLLPGEFICPASKEGYKRITCDRCKACSGGLNTHKGNPVIIVHGRWANNFNPV